MRNQIDQSQLLIQSLKDPSRYPHSVVHLTVLETHISWVVLTGHFAYKIKKPVDLGFVDFSTLALRHHACLEELRLNGRLAPTLYLDVMPIGGTPADPILGDATDPFEFAVKMKEFPAEAILDQALPAGSVYPRHIDQLAEDMGRFHQNLAPDADNTRPFGNPELIRNTISEVFTHLPQGSLLRTDEEILRFLHDWMKEEHGRQTITFTQRKSQGFIRECHGDLHLGNVVLLEDRATPFDGIEFSERLRWIDVISDVSFFIMDLLARGRPDLSARFLNRYLEYTGDYDGMSVLRFYEVYRALVRAKVAHIRLSQVPEKSEGHTSLTQEFRRYLSTAQALTKPDKPHLLIMHGLSGTGKSTVAQTLLESMGAIRLRSDIERKRMAGMSAMARSADTKKAVLYGEETTNALYEHLRNTASQLLDWGYSVIVDATFLKRRHRDVFRELAMAKGVGFLLLDIQASVKILQQRIVSRAEGQTDPSEADLAVLKLQQVEQEPLGADEQPCACSINSEKPFDAAIVAQRLKDCAS